MKIKSFLSFCLPAALMSLAVSGCSDYDNGYTEGAIKFNQDFRAAFGNIDPEQDWNLAERGNVTVTTSRDSEVKIYALKGNEYCIVGDYTGIKGTQTLGFDMLEGTKSIMVSDGRTAVSTVVGGTANFSGTRTVYTGKNGDITVTMIDNEAGHKIGDVTYPMWLEATKADYDAMKNVVPEIGYRQDHTNLNKVTKDFTYVSTGKFIIYPYYWETSSTNTIGIYYTDANGQYHEVDVYTNKSGDDFQYKSNSKTIKIPAKFTSETSAGSGAKVWYEYNAFTWTGTSDNQIYHLGLPSGNLSSYNYKKLVINYEMKGKTKGFRVMIYRNSGDPITYRIDKTADGAKATKTIELNDVDLSDVKEIRLSGDTYQDSRCNFEEFDATSGEKVIGDVEINEMYLERDDPNTDWQTFTGNFCSELVKGSGDKVRGQGIEIDIPKNTVFGMYLKKRETKGDGTTADCKFFSESAKNTDAMSGYGVTDDGAGHVTRDQSVYPSYASTFTANGHMFLGFEDWPNYEDGCDFDLNDIVLAFSGATPTIIDEDGDKAGTWLLACEDLGGSFDIDYNDVVFKVEHISGRESAIVTPLAAGGTLASYIFFEDPTSTHTGQQCLGEIHQLFGAAPAASGAYTPINVGSNRADKVGSQRTIQVGKDWTMAYYSTDTWHDTTTGVDYGHEAKNMGGFEVRVLKSGTEAPSGNVTVNNFPFGESSRVPAPDLGEAPYIICLPYSYDVVNLETRKVKTYVWAWPVELQPIDAMGAGKGYSNQNGPYPDFSEWVSNHDDHKDWYKTVRRDLGSTVSELSWGEQDYTGLLPSPLSVKDGSVGCTYEFDLMDYVSTLSTGKIHWAIKYNGGTWHDGTVAPGEHVTYTAEGAANLTIEIWQEADNKFEASDVLSFTLKIYKIESNLTLTASPSTVQQGGTVTLTLNTPNSNGLISYSQMDSSIGTFSGNTFKVSENCAPGTYTITAVQAESTDGRYKETKATAKFTVTEKTSSKTLTATKSTSSTGDIVSNSYDLTNKYVISNDQFSGLTGPINVVIGGNGGDRYQFFIGNQEIAHSDGTKGSQHYNAGNYVVVKLSAQDVEYAKTYGLTIFCSGSSTLTFTAVAGE